MQQRWRGFASRDRIAESRRGSILARSGRSAQRPPTQFLPAAPDVTVGDYAFLVGSLVDRGTVERAIIEAGTCGVAPHAVLLAAGNILPNQYATLLAGALGVATLRWDQPIESADEALFAVVGGQACHVVSATEHTPREVRDQISRLRALGIEALLAPQSMIDARLEAHTRSQRVDHAVRALLRQEPESSAGARGARWQLYGAILLLGLVIGGVAVLPEIAVNLAAAVVSLPFLCVTLLRMLALFEVLIGSVDGPRRFRTRTSDEGLPVYSVLVPLLREADVLPSLVSSLQALDYPPAKLDVVLVLEAGDTETQAGLLALHLPGNFRTVFVPHCEPRTKPKALNYALQFARGDFVVVYDAEDRPQPDQLRRALHAFDDLPPNIGCLQARLNIYNPSQSWFTRGIMAQTPRILFRSRDAVVAGGGIQ